ncbi:MGMT family protein [Caldimonas mangrovi]|uniref:MGMT family protein n=1 Tax=Caldimonas mangrovi TaxID=2944811 RepID=UPI0034A4041C
MKNRNALVCKVALSIPRGFVATYGQVAQRAGLAGAARQVGYALHALPGNSPVPWHRVVNTHGQISRRSDPGPEVEQRIRLELEGVQFDARGRVLAHYFAWRRGLE